MRQLRKLAAMRKSRDTEKLVISVIKQAKSRWPIKALCGNDRLDI